MTFGTYFRKLIIPSPEAARQCLPRRSREVAMPTTIKVNGIDRTVDVNGDTPLMWVLRDVLGLTGTKVGCGMALCGACTVHVQGVATRSCVTLIDSLADTQLN